MEINGTSYIQKEARVWPRLIYGDQLTSAHVQGAIALHCFHKTLSLLAWLCSSSSDWHARLCLVTVSLYAP